MWSDGDGEGETEREDVEELTMLEAFVLALDEDVDWREARTMIALWDCLGWVRRSHSRWDECDLPSFESGRERTDGGQEEDAHLVDLCR